MKTLFERIATKEIPANLLYGDEHVIAFHDVHPHAPTHILIVPLRGGGLLPNPVSALG